MGLRTLGLNWRVAAVLIGLMIGLLTPAEVLAAGGAALPAASVEEPAATPAAPPAAAADPAAATSAEPEKVFVGTYINDIQKIDLQSNSYIVDLYVWFRWKKKDFNPLTSMEYMNPFQKSEHVSTPLYDAPQDLPDGSKYMAVRTQGAFSSKLPLARYPFDKQTLVITFEDNELVGEEMTYVPDDTPITLNKDITLPGYIVGTPSLTAAVRAYPTNFGDPREVGHPAYSRVTISIPVRRPILTNAIKVLLPLFLIVACAGLVFFIHPDLVDARIGLGITALLSLVALQLTSATQMPEVDYLTLTDQVYYAGYAFVLFSIAHVVRTCWPGWRQNAERAVIADRRWVAGLTLTFLAAVALIFYASIWRV